MPQSEVACPPGQYAVLIFNKSKGSYYENEMSGLCLLFRFVSWGGPIKFYIMLLISWVLPGLISQENGFQYILEYN